MGPNTEASDALHGLKYRTQGEAFRESINRIASVLTDSQTHYHQFRDIIGEQAFLPAGRIQAAAGTTKNTTLYNCFVSGHIEDSSESIMHRLSEAWTTMRMGGGIGYDFSRIRPNGDLVRSLQSTASGPVSFMDIYDSMGRCVASSGHRRGAQMGILRVDHPDIETFIHAKQNTHALTGFNISVAVTDEFMHAVANDAPFDLRFEGRTYRTIEAPALWESIMRSTWDWAEPGVVFIDRMNDMNNLNYCETIEATNPCSEQPLPPFGACLLGSFNLVKYLLAPPLQDIESARYTFDYDKLRRDIPIVVRAMDRVVDIARYPLPAQRAEAMNKRRMGLGVTGMANTLEAMGFAYGSADYIEQQAKILKIIRDETYMASALLAKEFGSFPLYDERYLDRPFIQSLPDHVRSAIEKHGIRNSHLTSIAPTGTISLCADNVSSGIEPVWAYEYPRTVNTPDGMQDFNIVDYAANFLNVRCTLADNVSAREHVAVLASAQEYVDSAISKTCNVPGDMPWADFKNIYREAWLGGAKSCSTFNKHGKRMGLLTEAADDSDGGACYVDAETGLRECS